MRPILLLCVLALVGAGCLGPQAPPPDAADAPAPAALVTSLDDANASAPGWHLHDYWEGQSRLVAVDDVLETGGWRCTGCAQIPLRFRGDPGMVIPLGTSHLEVTVEWEMQGETRHAQPELWVKAANASEPRGIATLESGRTVIVNTTNEEADPPHQALSRWELWVMLPSIDDEAYFAGSVSVFAEAVRGLPIPAFPPHPDLWQGRDEIPLFDATNPTILQRQNVDEGSRTCQFECLATHRPDDGVIVPYDASEIVVTLTYEAGMPTSLWLVAHGGDTWEMQRAEGQPTVPNALTFRIPVTPETGDSPYAKQSLWEFEVVIDQPTSDRVFAGGYRLQATALSGA